jgi:hypothetical protein
MLYVSPHQLSQISASSVSRKRMMRGFRKGCCDEVSLIFATALSLRSLRVLRAHASDPALAWHETALPSHLPSKSWKSSGTELASSSREVIRYLGPLAESSSLTCLWRPTIRIDVCLAPSSSSSGASSLGRQPLAFHSPLVLLTSPKWRLCNRVIF